MKYISALAVTALLFAASPAKADVMVHDPESYETAIGMKVGAALMGLHSSEDDKLVSATSPICERVEIHTMSEENGIMKMRKVDDITLPADKIVKLEPSGYHLMLINLKEPLKAGTEFPITLTFEKAKSETVTVKVLSRSELTKTLDQDAAKTEEHHH